MGRLVALIAAVAGALLLALAAAQPPAPLGADASPDRFSAGRAMADIAVIAHAPHPTGSAEDARVRAYLVQRLQALGLSVQTQISPLSARSRTYQLRWGQPASDPAQAVNVVGVLAGADRTAPAVLLMAHHDTVFGSPGAADNTAGVAAILETLRALRSGPALARDVIVVFSDAEELGSDGAKAFFAADPLARRAGVVINMDARGGGGRALMFETGPGNGPMMALFGRAVGNPSANSAAVLVYRLIPNQTDFSIPKKAGTPGFNFAFLGRTRLYHSAEATPAAIDAGSVQHIGGQVLDLTRALALASTLPARGPDRVFSDLFGLGFLGYPAWGGWIVLAAAAAMLVFTGVRARAAGLLTWAGTLGGAAAALGVVLAAAALLQIANLVSGAGRGANYYGRLAALPVLELQALFISLAVLCLAGCGVRREASAWSSWLGLAGLILILSAGVQAVAPGGAPIFAWPLVLCAGAAALAAATDLTLGGRTALALVAVAGAAGGGYVLGLAHFAFLGVGADMPGAMAVFLLLVAMPVWPLLRGAVAPRTAMTAAALLLIAGFGLALSVRVAPPAPTIPIYARAAR